VIGGTHNPNSRSRWSAEKEERSHSSRAAQIDDRGLCRPQPGPAQVSDCPPRPQQRGASIDPQGYDAGKKVTGRKRHILVDSLGLMLNVAVHPANIQDRDGAALVLDSRTRALFSFIERIFADSGYQGPRVAQAAAARGRWIVEIVKRTELHKFVVLPKRWIVERTLAWISRSRDWRETSNGTPQLSPLSSASP
jgi:transposase